MANHTVLLIDYEPKSIERIVRPLQAAGFAVETATDGISGLDAFDRLEPGLVIIEAMIPKKHGFEVCQEIKKSQRGKRTPVVITTAVYKGRKYRTQALHIYGCDEYVEKPIAEDALVALVRRLVGSGPEPIAIASKNDAPVAVASEHAPAPRPTGGTATAVKSVPKPSSMSAIVGDLTEQEIMDRLDALLPSDPFEGDDESLGSVISSLSKSGSSEVVAAASPSFDLTLDEEEETAEGSADGVFHLPQDHADIPAPAPMPAPVPEPEPAKLAADTAQVVSFEDVKSRRSRRAAPVEVPAAPALPPIAAPAPKVEARKETPRPVTISNDEDTRKPAKKSGGAIWIGGAVAGVVLLAGAYMLWFRESEPAAQTQMPAPAFRQAPVQPPAAQEPAPIPAESEPAASAPEEPAPSDMPTRARQAAAAAASAAPGADVKPRTEPAPKPAAPPPAAAAPTRPVKTAPPVEKKDAESGDRASPATTPPAPVPGSLDSLALDAPPPPSLATGTLPAPKVAALTLIAEDADVPPVAVNRPLPSYTPKARALRQEGTVVFRLLIDETGRVEEAHLIRGIAGSDLNDAALRAARKWTYKPARKDGEPVKVWKVEEVNFKR